MAEDPPEYRRRGAVARAVGTHGTDTEEEYFAHPVVVLLQSAIALIPAAAAAGAGVGAAFTPEWVSWGLIGFSALLAWPSLVGLAGTARLLAGMGNVALIYKDRLVVQRGSSPEDILWDDVEAVYVRTQTGNSENIYFYEPGKPTGVWIGTEVPLAKFWLEWTEVHTRDGRVVRLPSTITDYENLSRAVQRESALRLVPKALAEHQAGRIVPFGPLAVEAGGLRIGNYLLRWREHQCSWAEGGHVVTTNTSGSRVGPTVLLEHVPNWAVAAYLINHVSGLPEDQGNDS